ncbi:MAG: c-type cytochrome domain-containing protein [Planctomycetota bacterium]
MDQGSRQSRLYLLLIPLACSPLGLLGFYSGAGDWTVFLGRFHPVVLHMPIGILLLTALMESLNTVSRGKVRLSIMLPLLLGTTSAVAAMSLGVLLMRGESMEGDLVRAHLIWGIATAVIAVLALTLRCLPNYPTPKTWTRPAYLVALLGGCVVMTWASHIGASITHGPTYLTEHIPWKDDAPSEEETQLAKALTMPTDERLIYEHVIVPIFSSKCYECHQTQRFKGRLVMDTYEGLIEGGATGPSIVPGNVAQSLAITRVHLPLADEEHMPPANKPQMSEHEIALVEWWVKQGAMIETRVETLKPDDAIRESLALVSTELLAELEVGSAHEDHHELSYEEVEAMRVPHAAAMAELMSIHTGEVRYANAQSNEIVVRAFHSPWGDQDLATLRPVAERVTRILLPRSRLSQSSVGTFNAMTNLEVLDLRESDIGDQWLAGIHLPHLKKLNLFGTYVSDKSIDKLLSFNNLQELYLGKTHLTDFGIAVLRESLPQCNVYHVSSF